VAVADGLLQLGSAGRRRVLGEVPLDGADGGPLDVIGRREIRLAGPEIHHVGALGAKPFGVGRHFHVDDTLMEEMRCEIRLVTAGMPL